MSRFLSSTISALISDLIAVYGEPGLPSSNDHDEAQKFLFEQMERMPWLPRFGIQTMTVVFSLVSPFYAARKSSNPEAGGSAQLASWSRSRFKPCRDFVKFYAAMVVLSLESGPGRSGTEGHP